MRKRFAVRGFPPHIAHAIGVDHQQHEVVRVREKSRVRARPLIFRREMDEALGVERRRPIRAEPDSALPGLARCEVVQHRVRSVRGFCSRGCRTRRSNTEIPAEFWLLTRGTSAAIRTNKTRRSPMLTKMKIALA